MKTFFVCEGSHVFVLTKMGTDDDTVSAHLPQLRPSDCRLTGKESGIIFRTLRCRIADRVGCYVDERWKSEMSQKWICNFINTLVAIIKSNRTGERLRCYTMTSLQ